MTHAAPEHAMDHTRMLTALVRLRGALQLVRLPLAVPGVEERRQSQSRWSTSSRTMSSQG